MTNEEEVPSQADRPERIDLRAAVKLVKFPLVLPSVF